MRYYSHQTVKVISEREVLQEAAEVLLRTWNQQK